MEVAAGHWLQQSSRGLAGGDCPSLTTCRCVSSHESTAWTPDGQGEPHPTACAGPSAAYAVSMTTSPSMPTAAMLVIGDELLTGKFQDTNSPWVAKRCRELGISLRRIIVLPDILDEIAAAVAEWSTRVDHVFTSGGVGPTHDDLTMEGIALGLGRPIVRHDALHEAIKARMAARYTEAAGRMADVPSGAELWWDGELSFPQVVVGNVIVFPGVPALLRLKFDAIAHRLGGAPRHHARLTTTRQEAQIADELSQIAARWPTVAIGSYPQFDRKPWTVTLTFDSHDPDALVDAMDAARQLLGPSLVEQADA